MTIKEQIGSRVREVRLSLDMTQSEVSEASGVGVKTISRIERAEQGVTFENIARIAEALDVPFREFTDIEQDNQEIRKEGQLRAFFRLLEDATPDEVSILYDLAKSLQEHRRGDT